MKIRTVGMKHFTWRRTVLSVLVGIVLFVFACYVMVFFRETGVNESEVWEAQRAEQEMMCR